MADAPTLILTDWNNRQRVVQLGNHDLPEPPLQLGGKQRKKVTRYAGTGEVSAQMLGLEPEPIQLSGRIEDADHGPGYARQAVDALLEMYRSETLVKLEHGPDRAWGLLDLTALKRHDGDFAYELELEVLWTSPPEASKPATFETPPPDAAAEIDAGLEQTVARAKDEPNGAAAFAADILAALLEAQAQISKVAGIVAGVANWVELGADVAAEVKTALVGAALSLSKASKRIREATSSTIAGTGPAEAAGVYFASRMSQEVQAQKFSVLQLLRRLSEVINPIGAREYVAKQGDTLEQLALNFYGDFTLWTRIADANDLEYGDLEAGQILTIPRA